jgi:WD40 repeat protein
MTTQPDLETRVRTGLRAAFEAIPPAPRRPIVVAAQRQLEEPAGSRRRTGAAVLAAAAAAVVAVAGVAAVTVTGDDDSPGHVESSPTHPSTSNATEGPATAGDHEGPGEDPVAGSAVVNGDTLVTYGPDGEPGETVPLAPLTGVQSVVPDRHGGWIACGDASASTVYRFRLGQAPEPIDIDPVCASDSLGVTLVDGREVLYYISGPTLTVRQYDLAAGADGPLPMDVGLPLPGQVAVGGGRMAVLDDAGLRVWDLATGEPVAVPDADLGGSSALALSPDGTTLAALIGDLSASDVVVFDLATGDELFRRPVAPPIEGDQLSYDGTSVAVGSFYEGPVRIYDLASGAERTIDAHGVLP